MAGAAILTILGLGAPAPLQADETWADPTTGSSWDVPANWSGNAAPTSTDDVFTVGTASNNPITITAGSPTTYQIHNLSVDRNMTEIDGGAQFHANDVTVGATVAGQSFTTLQEDDAGTFLSMHNLTVTGAANSQNFVDLYGGDYSITGTITLGGTGAFNDTLDIEASPTSGILNPAALVINSNGSLFTEDSGTLTVNTTMSGSGLIGSSEGTLVLQGDGSGFSGELSVESGTMQIESATLLGGAQSFVFQGQGTGSSPIFQISTTATTSHTSVIDVTQSNGTITVDSGQVFTHRGTIIDSGLGSTLTKDGLGSFLLNGDGSGFSGTTVVNNGLCEIEQNHDLGDGAATSAAVVNGGELRIDPLGNLAVQNLTVNAGGLLTNNGLIASGGPLTVQVLGGTLAGSGTFDLSNGTAQVTVGNGMGIGGTIEVGTPSSPNTAPVPAADIGSMIIYGNLTLNSDATTIFKIAGSTHNAAPVAGTDYDQLEVSGVVKLGGTLVVQAASGVVQPGDHFDFITANGGFDPAHDSFDTVNILNNALSYTQGIVNAGLNYELTLTATQNSFASFAQTPNQAAIAAALDTQFANLGNTAIITALDNISGSALPNALEQMSPQPLQVLGHIAFDNASFDSQQLNNHLANLRDGLTGFDGSQLTITDAELSAPLAQIKGRLLAWDPTSTPGLMSDVVSPTLGSGDRRAEPDARDPFSTFIAGNVILADLSHNNDLAHQDYTTGTVSLGGDYRIDRHWTLGGMFSYAHTDASLDHIGSNATVDSYSPAIYASYVDGGWYANALAAYDFNDYSEQRNVNFGAGIPGVAGGVINGTNQGDFDGNQFTGNVTGGYEFQRGEWKFGPVASAQYVNLAVNSFQEQGPTALNIDRENADSFRTQLGFEARYGMRAGSVYLTPHASVSWQHEFLDGSRGITSSFNGSGAGSFSVATSTPDRDSAFVDVGLNADITHAVTLFTDYTTQAGQADFFAQSVQAGIKIEF